MREGTLKGESEVVQNLLLSGRFTIAEIAGFTNVDERFVRKIKAAIT